LAENENTDSSVDDLFEDILAMNSELSEDQNSTDKDTPSIETSDSDPAETVQKQNVANPELDHTKPKRKRRDPFKDMDQVSSSEAALKSRDLASRSELKKIQKAGVRLGGKKVVTDDVKKLKSLVEDPDIPDGEIENYYREPVRIEYYIPKESRFNVETRHLYIPLLDPEIQDPDQFPFLKKHMDEDAFFDLITVMNDNPGKISDIIDSYGNIMNLYETNSRLYREMDESPEENLKKIFYLCEVLLEYEPTIAALEFLGPFQTWNLNWLIRNMNLRSIEFAASDKTVSYLIKMRNIYWEENHLEYDEKFEVLAALFYEQAYPNRGLTYEKEDYFFDIFDKKRF